ncbi:hypothetical protein AB0M46_37890 [Dactylosporangium sp. NPDC051485]|uniref:hypothetical protein n=1 Tax=Dactylosporangium sp. NPDC051485 TaxID=3154846 RepID=UPI0034239A57
MLVITVWCTVFGLLLGWAALDEARGGVVDAEVVDIKSNFPGRRVYDVRFEAAGRVCESRVDSGSNPVPRDIYVGGHSRLQYSASDPCGKVRETIAAPLWPFAIVAVVIMVACWVGVWRLRLNRTEPAGAGPPAERRQAS